VQKAASAHPPSRHNIAWAIAREYRADSVVIDLDLAFGTAGLDYNQDPLQGIANAVVLARSARHFIHGSGLLSKCNRPPQPAGGAGGRWSRSMISAPPQKFLRRFFRIFKFPS